MIKSMTAFARVASPSKQGGWQAELRSINSRYFDFSLRVPPAISSLENQIREFVQSRIPRGKVSVSLSRDFGDEPKRNIKVNEESAVFYFNSLHKLAKKLKLREEFSASDLLRLPGVFEEEKEDLNPEKNWPQIKKLLGVLVQKAIESKELEGGKLCKDIFERLKKIEVAVVKIENHSKGLTDKIYKKLSERIDSLVQNKELDTDRLHREVAFLAERSDITEEIIRLRSHIHLFEKKLNADGEAGRELDFICQEMNREINTMGSKSQQFEISTEVVFLKGELEKIREQVQNIE